MSDEMRRLEAKWRAKTGWPKWLDYLEINGLRGWAGQRFACTFPIMAVVGENGVGKSSILQCAASIYQPPKSRKGRFASDFFKGRFASDFFPDTAWEIIQDATIGYSVRQGDGTFTDSMRKPGTRWRGNPERPVRDVAYIDLSRIQPVPERVGYSQLAKSKWHEVSADSFDKNRLARLSQVMGRTYEGAKMSLTNGDKNRSVPVLKVQGSEYSGFHQGAGETTVAELLEAELPPTSIILIDEIETSLHPRSQRRLIRHLAQLCRERELQVILTTHSPYVLDELPLEARAYIMLNQDGRSIVYGTSPEFAMSRMDDVPQTECDIYLEDDRARAMMTEILAASDPPLVHRCMLIAYGAGSVGKALGTMAADQRFPRPTCVFLDGDQGTSRGCANLPGEDPPERIVFTALKDRNWQGVDTRTGRAFSKVADACSRAMTLTDHHDWLQHSATALVLGTDILWQAMCAEWATNILDRGEADKIAQVVRDSIERIVPNPEAASPPTASLAPATPPMPRPTRRPKPAAANGSLPLFELSPNGAQE